MQTAKNTKEVCPQCHGLRRERVISGYTTTYRRCVVCGSPSLPEDYKDPEWKRKLQCNNAAGQLVAFCNVND